MRTKWLLLTLEEGGSSLNNYDPPVLIMIFYYRLFEISINIMIPINKYS